MTVETTDTVDFTLPSLGSDMDEGTVLEWLVAAGDRVSKGDVLLRVDTEKAEIDVEVWQDAIVSELLVAPGETVPVGTPLARLLSANGAPGTPVEVPSSQTEISEAPTSSPVAMAAPSAPIASSATPRGSKSGQVQPTPRLVYWPAAHQPSPTGSASSPSAHASQSRPEHSRSDRRQHAVAALMQRSNNEIPHFHLTRRVDLAGMLDRLEAWNDSVPPSERILPAAVFLYAVAQAAADSPVNGTYADGPIDATAVDLGIAVHVRGGGLMTPVLPAAHDLALDELMRELQAIVGRTRAGRLSSRDMTPATLTVTNLGDSGADQVIGVIRPPERGLVGYGRIADRACVVGGALQVRPTVDVTLSADHRVINGQAGARFLDAVATTLGNPNSITFTAPS